MSNNEVYKLSDLVNSDFQMSTNDQDYKLSQEHLIKVCKILLHKINHNHYKSIELKEKHLEEVCEKIEESERKTKSAMEEVN